MTKRLACQPLLWLLIIIPLLMAPPILETIRGEAKMFLFGEIFVFDGGRRTLLKNGFEVCPFSQVDSIQVCTQEDEATTDYFLSVMLLDETEIEIDWSPQEKGILRAAEEIPDFVGVKVVKD